MSRHSSEHPGRQIRRRRESAGLTRIGLAYKAGVDISTVARIENGAVWPRRATLEVIERALAGTRGAAAA